MTFVNPQPSSASSDQAINTQVEFDYFYSTVLELLNQFYPEQTVTMTTRDPEYITPDIKTKLIRKNKRMRAGRVETITCSRRTDPGSQRPVFLGGHPSKY